MVRTWDFSSHSRQHWKVLNGEFKDGWLLCGEKTKGTVVKAGEFFKKPKKR